MFRNAPDKIDEEIVSYWDVRSTSYSKGVNGELADNRHDMWRKALSETIGAHISAARDEGRVAKALDIGCGPGFFSILLAEQGASVDAVDSSEEMLARARENVGCNAPDAQVAYHESDFTMLPFEDDRFDVAVCRNVTWLMRAPESAYAEWLRVLRPGGKLVVFDANWYRYLIDAQVAESRAQDMAGNTLEGWDEEAQATSDEEKHCEEIAKTLPMTFVLRPGWDLAVLPKLGASRVLADEDIWLSVWSENEKAYYRSTPMFLVEAIK